MGKRIRIEAWTGLTFLVLAVSEDAQQPLHYKEITKRALEQELIVSSGLTPDATMGARLYLETKKENTRFERAGKGMFTIKRSAYSDDISRGVSAINNSVRRNLAKRLRTMPADRFETLIGELLIAIGFDESSVQVTSYSSDGGIDVRGVLNAGDVTEVNAAVQAKRWKGNVGAGVVRDVRGSLTTQEQGIIITTSNFTKAAREEANSLGKSVISLVNGEQLVDLLVKHAIGVTKEQHAVLSLDEEWWDEVTGIEAGSSPTPVDDKLAAPAKVVYPLTVRAINNHAISANMISTAGDMNYQGKQYNSPSSAGKEASGWKSCNGWVYWQFQHPESKEWRLIDDLRQQPETP
jgi:restriction system protein